MTIFVGYKIVKLLQINDNTFRGSGAQEKLKKSYWMQRIEIKVKSIVYGCTIVRTRITEGKSFIL